MHFDKTGSMSFFVAGLPAVHEARTDIFATLVEDAWRRWALAERTRAG